MDNAVSCQIDRERKNKHGWIDGGANHGNAKPCTNVATVSRNGAKNNERNLIFLKLMLAEAKAWRKILGRPQMALDTAADTQFRKIKI